MRQTCYVKPRALILIISFKLLKRSFLRVKILGPARLSRRPPRDHVAFPFTVALKPFVCLSCYLWPRPAEPRFCRAHSSQRQPSGLLMEQGTESDESLVDTRGQSSSNFSLLFCQQVYGKHKKAKEHSLNHRAAIKRYYEAVKVVFEIQSRRAHGRWPRRRTQRPSIFLFMSVQRSAFPGETDPVRRDVFVLLYLYASCSLSLKQGCNE